MIIFLVSVLINVVWHSCALIITGTLSSISSLSSALAAIPPRVHWLWSGPFSASSLIGTTSSIICSVPLYLLVSYSETDHHQLLFILSVYVWLLGRQTTYPGLVPSFIENNLQSALGVSLNDLEVVDHSEQACYVLPAIEPGEAVILPGQCDPNIAVVQNFDVVAVSIINYYSKHTNNI